MRKNVFGRRLSRHTKGRTALFKNLITSLIKYGRIKTTEAKGKAIKGLIDKVVGAAKGDSVQKRRFLLSMFSKDTVKKLVKEIAPRFQSRVSGFTRTTKIGTRLSDNAPMVMMEWVENIEDRKLKIEDRKEAMKTKAKKSEVTTKVESRSRQVRKRTRAKLT